MYADMCWDPRPPLKEVQCSIHARNVATVDRNVLDFVSYCSDNGVIKGREPFAARFSEGRERGKPTLLGLTLGLTFKGWLGEVNLLSMVIFPSDINAHTRFVVSRESRTSLKGSLDEGHNIPLM